MTQEMTDCPVCKNEVPRGAPRCKHCFSDLTEHWSGGQGGSNPLWGVIVLGLVFAVASSWVYYTINNQEQLGQVTVDPKEQRIVLVYTSTTNDPTTRQLYFNDVSGIEMEANQNFVGGNQWLVYLVTTDGERVLVNRSRDQGLEAYATNLQQHTNKPLTIINNIRAGSDMVGI